MRSVTGYKDDERNALLPSVNSLFTRRGNYRDVFEDWISCNRPDIRSRLKEFAGSVYFLKHRLGRERKV